MKKSLFLISTMGLLATTQFAFAITPTNNTQNNISNSTTSNINAPDTLIKNVVNEVLDTLKNQKGTNVKKINEIVNEKIMPHTDLETTTKMIMGPNWNKATPEQHNAIMQEFKQLLVLTYSGALSKAGDQKIEYKPLKILPTDTRAIVKSNIIEQSQTKSIDYRLHKVKGQWKVYDINVLGVGLVSSYKNDFAQQINTGGIDGLIKFLQNKNKKA